MLADLLADLLAGRRRALSPAELFCPSGNVDYNANWPSGVPAGTYTSGAYCKPGWTGSIGRQCQLSGQWAVTATGGCTRTRGGSPMKAPAPLPASHAHAGCGARIRADITAERLTLLTAE